MQVAPDFEAELAKAKKRFVQLWDTPLLDEQSRTQLREAAARMTLHDISITPVMYRYG